MAAEVPWWSNLVAILGTAIVSVLGTAYFLKGSQAPAVSGPPGFGALLKETLTYLPHIMLLFGVLADMFTMQGVYSIPSLVGLLSIPLSYGMKYFWTGIGESIGYITQLLAMGKTSAASSVAAVVKSTATQTPPVAATVGTSARPRAAIRGGAITNYDGCAVQGASGLQSRYAVQTLVVTATVFWYYILDLMVNRGPADASMSLGVFIIFFVAEMMIIGECPIPDAEPVNIWLRRIISMSEGALFGGLSYGIVQAYKPMSLPSAVLPLAPRISVDKLKPNSDGTLTDPKSGTSYVLVNGIPTLNTCATKDGVGGLPALPGSCPS